MGSSKNDSERKVFDVHASRRNSHPLYGHNVINLKPKFRIRHPLIFTFVFFALLFVLFIGIRQFSTRAEVQDLYPTTCLGNWQNVANAEGVPETLNVPSPSFSPDNSAAYDASGTEIYCGGFLPPSFATSGQITNVGLTLVWQIEDAPTSSTMTATTTAESTVSETSSTPDITTASSSDDATDTTDVTDTSVATTTDDVSTPTSTPVPTPTPAPDPTTDSSSTSFIRRLIPFAFADDADSGTILSASTTTTIASDTDASNTAITAVEQPVSTPDDNFLDVSYSTDGQTWISVGEVNMSNWQNFTVTLTVSDWTDLQNLQVRVEGIPTTQDPIPPIYLDGMLLEVHYDAVSLPVPLLPPPVLPQVASTTNQEIPPPPPRMVLVSSGAQQSCDVQPFSQELPLGGTATFTVNLHPSITGISYNLLLGYLPLGISAGFGSPSGAIAATSSLTFQAETNVTPGSLNIPVIYQEHEENGETLSNFCQLNVDVK
jgi:hypothetical protein